MAHTNSQSHRIPSSKSKWPTARQQCDGEPHQQHQLGSGRTSCAHDPSPRLPCFTSSPPGTGALLGRRGLHRRVGLPPTEPKPARPQHSAASPSDRRAEQHSSCVLRALFESGGDSRSPRLPPTSPSLRCPPSWIFAAVRSLFARACRRSRAHRRCRRRRRVSLDWGSQRCSTRIGFGVDWESSRRHL